MLDKAAGHWLKWRSAARNGTAPHSEQLTPLMVSAHLSQLPHPKPLGTKIRACLAAGAVLVIEKTCDLVILALKPFFLDAVNLRHSYAFLFSLSHVHLMPFMQLHASRQSRRAAALGIYIWILPVSHGARSQSLHQLVWTPQRPSVRHNQWWVGALHDVLLFMLKKSMRDSYRPLKDSDGEPCGVFLNSQPSADMPWHK